MPGANGTTGASAYPSCLGDFGKPTPGEEGGCESLGFHVE